MERWGIKGDTETLFKEANTDGQGSIRFTEFVDWAARKGLDLDTDDDALWAIIPQALMLNRNLINTISLAEAL